MLVMIVATFIGATAISLFELTPDTDLDKLTIVGDKTQTEIPQTSKTSLGYQEIRDMHLTGFETVFKEESYTIYEFEATLDDEIQCNGKSLNWSVDTCYQSINVTKYKDVVDVDKQGAKIVSYSEIKGIKHDSNTYDFNSEDYNGWVCGNKLCFLNDNDGGTSVSNRGEEFKCDTNNQCIIRSGETGGHKNLLTGEVVYTEGGVPNVQI